MAAVGTMDGGGGSAPVEEGARRYRGAARENGQDGGWAADPGQAARPYRPAPEAEERGALGGLLERLDPGITGTRALAVAALIAVVATGVFFWSTRPETESFSQSAPPPPPGTVDPAAVAPAPPTPMAAPTTAAVVVHVAGDVRSPGIVTLAPQSRVHEAVTAAGGLRPKAEVGPLNLARRIVDGEQITVGTAQPQPPAPLPAPSASAPTPVDLNTATLDQLQQLPGVGPVLAQRILDHRTTHGPFRTPDQLRDITGIGDRRYADLAPHIRV